MLNEKYLRKMDVAEYELYAKNWKRYHGIVSYLDDPMPFGEMVRFFNKTIQLILSFHECQRYRFSHYNDAVDKHKHIIQRYTQFTIIGGFRFEVEEGYRDFNALYEIERRLKELLEMKE